MPVEEPATTEEPLCAFCGNCSADQVHTVTRLGVEVDVCDDCRTRFEATPADAAPAPLGDPAAPALPPTLGQQSNVLLKQLQRTAARAAARPFTEEPCSDCGADVHVYRDGDGNLVALDRRSMLVDGVPPEVCWTCVDGTVENFASRDAETPDDPDEPFGARVTHSVVCPTRPAPANARLARRWQENRRDTDGRRQAP